VSLPSSDVSHSEVARGTPCPPSPVSPGNLN
jgi:hypothetical protein